MFCINCGTRLEETSLPEGAKFCPECGAGLMIRPREEKNAQAAERPAPPPPGFLQMPVEGSGKKKAMRKAGRKSFAWLWMPLTGIALGVVIIVLLELKSNLSGARTDSPGKSAEVMAEYEEDAPASDEAADGGQETKPGDSQKSNGSTPDDAYDAADGGTDEKEADGYEEDEEVRNDGEGKTDLAWGVIGKTTYLVDGVYGQVLQLEPDGTFTLTVDLLEGMGTVYGIYGYYEEDHHYEFFVDGRDFERFQGENVWGFRMETESACLVYAEYDDIGMVSLGMKFYLTDEEDVPKITDRWDGASAMQYGDLDLLDYLGEYSGWLNDNEIMVDIWWRDEESVNIGIYWFEGSVEVNRYTFFVTPTNLGGNVVRFVMDDEWHRLEIIPGYASESGYTTIFLDGDHTWPIVLVDVDNQPT